MIGRGRRALSLRHFPGQISTHGPMRITGHTVMMLFVYQITRVPADAPQELESLGSKYKFWFDSGRLLFKAARDTSGEDWAEKICAETARLLGLPHAEYEMASWESQDTEVRGVVSRNFCAKTDTLVLGNELLAEFDPAYATGVSMFHVSAHTIERVLRTIQDRTPLLPIGWTAPAQIEYPAQLFVGYLLLDALVGNTDRHHENWGMIRTPSGDVHLAPTFDHASSLGCHELDDKRSERLHSRDANFTVEAFAAKARSALYRSEEDRHPLLTREAFLLSARRFPSAGKYWLTRLQDTGDAELDILVDEVPAGRITGISAEFAKRLILSNKTALLGLRNEL